MQDALAIDGGYAEYKADCDQRYRDWFRLLLDSMGALELIAVVEPGQPVEGGSELISAVIGRTLVTAGDPIAIHQMSLDAQRFGPAVLAHMGLAQPLALRKLQTPAPGGTGCDGDAAACCWVRGAGRRATWCCCPVCTKCRLTP